MGGGKVMKGVVFLGSRRLEVRDFPVPEPSPGQVLVQLKCAAICGSDLHVYRRDDLLAGGKEPWIPGHEAAGVAAELGEGCQRIKVGDRVTVYHYLSCGQCEQCRSGYYQFCPDRRGLGQPNSAGPDADYVVVDERNCLILPDELDYEDGALIGCIAGTSFSALRKLCPNGEDTIAVFGQGPVGLMGTIMAKAMGARVIAVEPTEERRTLALKVGADEAVDPTMGDLGAAVRGLTGGAGADLALETSGSAAAHQGVLDVLRVNGKAVFVGFGAQGRTVNLTSIIGKQLTLMGSFVMPIHYYDGLVRFLLRHGLSARFKDMITHRFSLTEAEEAFRLADAGKAGKILFVWEQGRPTSPTPPVPRRPR